MRVGLFVDTAAHGAALWSRTTLRLALGLPGAAPATAVRPNSETPQTAAVAIILFITSISS